jgi:hypothetical protein
LSKKKMTNKKRVRVHTYPFFLYQKVFAIIQYYFAGGAGFCWGSPCPGAEGCSCTGPAVPGSDLAGDSFTGTEDITDSLLTEKIARESEVSINRIAVIVVTLLITVAAPLLPKRV